MRKRIGCALLLVGMFAMCGAVHAQAPRSFTVKILDGRTGEKITPDNVEVFINKSKTTHVEWVKMNDDGSAQVTLPGDASAVAVRVSYNDSMDYYVNCDVSKQKDTGVAAWYPLGDILSTGVRIPNDCAKPKDADHLKVEAKPGELIVFVRKQNFRDHLQD